MLISGRPFQLEHGPLVLCGAYLFSEAREKIDTDERGKGGNELLINIEVSFIPASLQIVDQRNDPGPERPLRRHLRDNRQHEWSHTKMEQRRRREITVANGL